MTLDEAIAKAKADGDVQLAEWLRQARGADAAAKWYTEKLRDANRTIRKLLNENAKLREQLAKARDPQRIGGTADPESFVYAIEQLREFRWQHATNDEEAIPYINNVADAHERENAKLRELARGLGQCAQGVSCEDCLLYDLSEPDHCREERLSRELGIEVPS